MAARKTPPRVRKVRVRLSLLLTHKEIKELEGRAAQDLRPIGQYIAILILQPSRAARRGGTGASAGDKRKAYEVIVPLTIPERRQLEERAKNEMRSVSNYVTKLVLEEIARKR